MIEGAPEQRNPPDEEALIRAAATGSRAAVETLVYRHYDYVHAVCRRVLRDPDDAEEARQEALYLVVKRIGSFQYRSSFRTWVHAIAVNAALDVMRRRRRAPMPVEEVPEVPVGGGPGAPAAGIDLRMDVDAALRELPHDFREAVVLRDLCDLEYAEISEMLGVPVGTVRSRISRGRSMLAERLGNF